MPASLALSGLLSEAAQAGGMRAGTASTQHWQHRWRGTRQAASAAWAAALLGCRWVYGQLGAAGRLHLGLFYCYGLYYSWAKRLTGAKPGAL